MKEHAGFLSTAEVARLNGEAFNRWLWDAASETEKAPDGRSWKQVCEAIKVLSERMRLCVVADKEMNSDVDYGAFALPDKVIGVLALAVRLPVNFYEVERKYTPEVKRAVFWHILQIDADPTWTTRALLPLDNVYRFVDVGYSVVVPRTDGFAKDRPQSLSGPNGGQPYVVQEELTGQKYMYDPVSRESAPLDEWKELHSPETLARVDEEKRKAKIDPLEFIRSRDNVELKRNFENWWGMLTVEQRKMVVEKGTRGVLLATVNIGLKPAASFDFGNIEWVKTIPMRPGVEIVGNDVYNKAAMREWFSRNDFDPDVAVSRFVELSVGGERSDLSFDDDLLLGVAYGIGREDAVKFAETMSAIIKCFGTTYGEEIAQQLVLRFGATEAGARLTAQFLTGGSFDRKDKGFENLVGPGFVRKHRILSGEQILYLIRSVLVEKHGYVFRTDRDETWIGAFKRTLDKKLIQAGVLRAFRP